jgi:predicted nucleic acid-binding protein
LILLDTSAVFAGLVPDQPGHESALPALERELPPHVLSPFVLAELDYFLASRGGRDAEIRFLEEVARGAYKLAEFATSDVEQAVGIIQRYGDLDIGLTDASIVVLAGRYGTNRVLTFDERHFRALRTPAGDPFVVLPADA